MAFCEVATTYQIYCNVIRTDDLTLSSDHSPSTIVRVSRRRMDAHHRRYLKQSSSHRLILFTEEPRRLPGNMRRTPEINLEDTAGTAISGTLHFAYNAGPSIVHNHVDATKLFLTRRKRGSHLRRLCDVQLQD